MAPHLPLPDGAADPALVEEVYDAIAVVGLLNFANRAALATGITAADDLR